MQVVYVKSDVFDNMMHIYIHMQWKHRVSKTIYVQYSRHNKQTNLRLST